MVSLQITREAQGQQSRVQIVSAPFRGLNTREAYNALRPDEARVLENWLPDGGVCRVRPGYTENADVTAAAKIATLATFQGASSSTLIGAGNGELHDVSSSSVLTLTSNSYTDDLWSTANFNGYLFGVNGSDTPWRYDGSSVGATGFTGVSPLSDLQTVSLVRDRLWFTKVGSADIEYANEASVTGALTKFQLSQIAEGGNCLDINAWTRDAGDGPDDYIVFIMSTGEAIVYQGNVETDFRIVGKYPMPAPVGKDCSIKIGGELVIMTTSGPIPMSGVVAGNAFEPENLGYWGKIAPSWRQDFTRFGSNPGWNAIFHDGLVYFVIPTGLESAKIYVLNTRVSAWTIYAGLPATMYAERNGDLYFGASNDGKVFLVTGGTDDGSEIVTLARQGFGYIGGAARDKSFHSIYPNIILDGLGTGQFQVDVDFQESPITVPQVTLDTEGSGGGWGDDWDRDWGGDLKTRMFWRSIRAHGRAVAPVVRTTSSADNVEWFNTRLMYTPVVEGGL